ncbi:MAG: NTP transferase domain-containing protein [Clostridiaceae bacterium]|nr:NTP transferase domain-containing protein [Clostridiaceae bacterium]
MNFEYIVVQAGGKGTRMEYLTLNKPKALVPINKLPMIFHLFKKYPNKKFIIIGDYKFDVLKKYLEVFAEVQYLLVDARMQSGTCSGIQEAMKYIPDNKAFMLIWSDLVLSHDFHIELDEKNYVGLSNNFRCRWRYENNTFEEIPSIKTGVSGMFIFKNKSIISDVPISGEFVKWLKNKDIKFTPISLVGSTEYGTLDKYKEIKGDKCRPFNRIIMKHGHLIKEGIDNQGQALAVRERQWYKKVKELNFKDIPEIYSYEPLDMERINGTNIYESNLSFEEKKIVINKIVKSLERLHNLNSQSVDYFSINETYINKTFDRLSKVRDLIPFANDRYIMINGKKCRNIYYYREQLEKMFDQYRVDKFKLIHGDCTFSNIMLTQDLQPKFIDPRGYFGFCELVGDEAYDWAKLYYSIKGNYDQFNLKKFRLKINKDDIEIKIDSNNWECIEEYFLELISDKIDKKYIKLLHSIIWLSLTTYAWEDYDSICGAFYNGLYYLEDVLE